MTRTARTKGPAAIAALLLITVVACHREERAVEGVARAAAHAELEARTAATLLDKQRAELAAIPLPTKSLYVDIHEPGMWANPFLSVDVRTLDLRVNLEDPNPSSIGQGTMLRPAAARRQEVQLRPSELARAVAALPPGAWPYGRVIAVAEVPGASGRDRPEIRRHLEAAIEQLNNLGVVVEEWPGT